MSFEYVTRDFIFDHTIAPKIQEEVPSHYIFPSVYIIYCKKNKKAYIGETTNIQNRMKQHLTHPEKKKLKNVKVIFSHYFNKSSVLDIESKLIENMSADKQYVLLNGNDGISDHHYYQRKEYQNTFENIWSNLKFDKLVKHDLLDIKNSDLFKYSPYKNLSFDQHDAIKNYFLSLLDNKVSKTTFILGSAGTGKTILAVYIIKLLTSEIDEDDLKNGVNENSLILLAQKVKQKIINNHSEVKIALVVPMTSLRKTLQNVFKNMYGLSRNMVIGPNEVKHTHYDLLIVDEAHRLKRRKNITGYKEFDKTNQHFNLDKDEGTELDWIILSSSNQLFFYDRNQSIRPTDIEKEKFEKAQKDALTFSLKSQLRVAGGNDYIDFVDRLMSVDSKLTPWKSTTYELRLFTYMPDMIAALDDKEKEHGLCRTISGYSWKWVSNKSSQPDVTIDGVNLYWNRTSKDWINSTSLSTEMGCIHTTQGYDLNYSAVIFGSDITYNENTGKIEIIKENYFDRNGKAGISTDQLHDYIINIYKTIMYRGIKGTFVYCFDKKLEKYFNRYIERHIVKV